MVSVSRESSEESHAALRFYDGGGVNFRQQNGKESDNSEKTFHNSFAGNTMKRTIETPILKLIFCKPIIWEILRGGGLFGIQIMRINNTASIA